MPPLPYRSVKDIEAFFRARLLPAEPSEYLSVHVRRYSRALNVVAELLWERRRGLPPEVHPTLLDVGPHLLTELFCAAFPVQVNTVGCDPGLEGHPHRGEHFDFDLNQAHDQSGWVGWHQHDVVYMGEMIEHLHASPRMVIGCVSRWVKPGGFLVLQTPNAVALARRWALLLGRHPYGMIREGEDRGHIREYTAPELASCGKFWQLELRSVAYENYFRLPHWSALKRTLYAALTRVPRTFRDGMTLIFHRPPNVPDPSPPSRRIRGLVEHAEIEGHALTIAGWALDLGRPGPAAVIELVHRGFTFAGMGTTLPRQDVVDAFGDARYLNAGFTITCPFPEGFILAELRVRTRDLFGDVAYLPLQGIAAADSEGREESQSQSSA